MNGKKVFVQLKKLSNIKKEYLETVSYTHLNDVYYDDVEEYCGDVLTKHVYPYAANPVSYTHLDVYKRQVIGTPCSSEPPINNTSSFFNRR